MRRTCLALAVNLLLVTGCNATISTAPGNAGADSGPAASSDQGTTSPLPDPSTCSGCVEDKRGMGGQPFSTTEPGSGEFVTTDSDGALVINKQSGGSNRNLWVADTNLPGVAKIDLDTLKIVGRYRTGGSSTSRTTVNSLGEAFIGARAVGTTTGKYGVTKILPLGTNCPPKSGGTTHTSTGADDVLPYGSDDCVAWHVETEGDIRGLAAQDIPGVNHEDICAGFTGQKEFDPKEISIDDQHFIWVGGLHGKIYKIDAATGTILINTKAPTGVYGMALAGDGKLWMSNGATFGFVDINKCKDQASCDAAAICSQTCVVGNCPATCDGATKAVYNSVYGYGITVDFKQRVWRSSAPNGSVMRYDPNAPADQRVTLSSSAGTCSGGGIAADASGWVWAASMGSHIARYNADTLEGINIPANTKGVAVDTLGRVFAVQYDGSVHMIEPGKTLSDYKLTLNAVPLKGIAYAYSDMTGVQTHLASGEPGWYRELFQPCPDGGNVEWEYLTWDIDAPGGTWAMFNVRSADTADALKTAKWYTVACIAPPGGKGSAKISTITGKLLEVEVRFVASGDLNNPASVVSARIKSFSVLHRCLDIVQ